MAESEDRKDQSEAEGKPEQAAEGSEGEERIAVFVCHCGGNISDVVDVEKVAEAARQMPGVVEAQDFVFMCSSTGQELIQKAIEEKGCTRVIVAACSPSLHEMTFRRCLERAGLNPYLYEPCNIREQCSWCHAHEPEGATEKAIRLVASAVAKVKRAEPLDKPRVPVVKRVAVIGGGIAGMRAALDVADRGLDVVLIEKSPILGGQLLILDKLYPTEEDAAEIVADLTRAVFSHPRISVHLYSEVVASTGYLGNFNLTVVERPRGVIKEMADAAAKGGSGAPGLVQLLAALGGCWPKLPQDVWQLYAQAAGDGAAADEERTLQVNVGAIIIATGYEHYTPRDGEFGYNTLPGVFTLPQAIRMLDPAGPTGGKLEVNGKPVRRVAIIHCVGSRQQPGIHEPGPDGRLNEYCSRVCCTASLQIALQIRNNFPDVDVLEFYQDIRAYGRDHETNYYEAANKAGVTFFRYAPEEPPQVEAGKNGWPLTVRVKDLLTYGEELEAGVDMVILSVGMVPRDISDLISLMKLPTGSDGFLLEVHPKLRPVELSVDGVMVAGAAQAPMDST